MKIEVTAKIIFDLGEYSGSIEDSGLTLELDRIVLDELYDANEMGFQSDNDEDFYINFDKGELTIKEIED